ncbi:hypothetical protein CLV30_1109 [Haloactinopolyspora alba]|uniref:Uncharacterized protein n=1 Tax=Haloactinopolyspora alba TaxID=648780 RepID=A0A2P8DYQ1_9ACTN|nr:hypothetical protein [Haloactinopolyspora alba]PSL02356.1 hypothetical protein CLV30_1109 [Haloactinopolyspora alba]
MSGDTIDDDDPTDDELLAQLRGLIGQVPPDVLERAADVRDRPPA